MHSVSNQVLKKSSSLLASNTLKRNDFLYKGIREKSIAVAQLKYAVAATTIFLYKSYKDAKKLIEGKKQVVKEYPTNTVVIYQFPRGYKTPSLSMFALKLETWCRAVDIKYQNEFSMKLSSQGLIPFIRLNNYVVEDSQKCIDYLSKVMQKDLNADLNEDQKAIARLILKMCDDSLKWTIALLRFWHSDKNLKENRLPLLGSWIFSYKVYKSGIASGYSRYSKEDLIENSKKDLKALNTLIGNKKFIFSDNKPSDMDFAVFGNIAQIIYNNIEPLNQFILTDCQNLAKHTENIKLTYWKDWDDNIRMTKQLKTIKPIKPSLINKIVDLVLKRN